MHNELSYAHNWPLKIMFFCAQPSKKGGETPVADSRKTLEFLSESTKSKFANRGIKYVRNLVKGLGLSWQEVYQTSDKHVVEAYCKTNGISYNWISDNHLRVSWTRAAIQRHPDTKELVWFNHGFFFNASNLDKAVHDLIGNEELLPFNTYYGDGSPIEEEVIEELRSAYEKGKIDFVWKQGDILLLDNMLMAHGRNPFEGNRKILVAMNDPFSSSEEVKSNLESEIAI